MSGPSPTSIAMRLSARTAVSPSLRSTAIARASIMPAAPVRPCTRRNAMNTSTVGVNAIATPDAANTANAMTNTGRLPNRSDRGPRIS